MAKATKAKSSKAKSSRARADKATKRSSGAAATRAPRKASAKRSAKKGKAEGKSRKPRQKPEPAAEQQLPEFAVAFIDGEGQAHVAVAAAPDPAAALAELLDQAAMFEESFLDDLVAVMVTHPSTWESVQTKLLDVFS